MSLWSPELTELAQYSQLFRTAAKVSLADEILALSNTEKAVDALNYARRVLELIVIEYCQIILKRERGSEPLAGILDKFAKEQVLPEHVISSMRHVNELGKYGTHPKEFAPRQVREALFALITVLSWYATQQGLDYASSYPTRLLDQEVNDVELEMIGGAVPLDSRFYVRRAVDDQFLTAIQRRDSIVLLKGARQMGKTSLLARGLQAARENGVLVVWTDLQKLLPAQLQSLEGLFIGLADMLAIQLNLDVFIQDKWREGRAANVNFDSYFRREILEKTQQNVLWAIDEADRLFLCEFSSELFSLFRTWHNERALNPVSPCFRLSLAIAYATETYLFIKDPNQSPFNVGTKLLLADFTVAQVADLNRRYGSPLQSEAEVEQFHRFLGGQPYLVRGGLNYLVEHSVDMSTFVSHAVREDGLYGDHLRRLLLLLRDKSLAAAVCQVLEGKSIAADETFSLLRRVGLLVGESRGEVKIRTELYARYLRKHLF